MGLPGHRGTREATLPNSSPSCSHPYADFSSPILSARSIVFVVLIALLHVSRATAASLATVFVADPSSWSAQTGSFGCSGAASHLYALTTTHTPASPCEISAHISIFLLFPALLGERTSLPLVRIPARVRVRRRADATPSFAPGHLPALCESAPDLEQVPA